MASVTKFASVLVLTILGVALLPFCTADSEQVISKAQLISRKHSSEYNHFKEIEKEVFVTHLLNQVGQLIVDTQGSNFIPKVTRKSPDILEIELVDESADGVSDHGYYSDYENHKDEGEGEPEKSEPHTESHPREFPVPMPRVSINKLYPDLTSFGSEVQATEGKDPNWKPTPRRRTNINGLYPDLSSFDSQLENSNHENNGNSQSPEWKPIPKPRKNKKKWAQPEEPLSDENLSDVSTDWGASVKDKAQKLEAMLSSKKTNANIEKVKKIGVRVPLFQENGKDDVTDVLNGEVDNFVPENVQPEASNEYSVVAEGAESSDFSNISDDLGVSDDSGVSDISNDYEESDDSDEETNGDQEKPSKNETVKEEGKVSGFFNALKSMVKSGASIFRSSSKAKLDDNANETEAPSKSGPFCIGNAAWTKSDGDNVSDRFDGGLDSGFIAKSEDGQMLAFGILDGKNIDGINRISKPFATEMCHTAQSIFETRTPSNQWSPLEVIKTSFQETLVDTSVSAGSVAALFGVIDEQKKLQLSYTGTAWTSVYRNGALVHQTRLMRDAEDEKYNLVKGPHFVKSFSRRSIEDPNDKVFESFENDSWSLEKGDIVLAATNGLYKRIGPEDIKKSIKISLVRQWGMQQAANSLIGTAIGLPQVGLDNKLFWAKSMEKNEDIAVLMVEM